MRTLAEAFNRSFFSRFLNSPVGRMFRLSAGTGFLLVGYGHRHDVLGIVAMIWSILPLTAGAFDICYISAALGGPISGARLRDRYQSGDRPVATPK